MSVLKSVVRSWEFQLELLLLERLRAGLQVVAMETVQQAVGHRVEAEAEVDMVKAHHKEEEEVEEAEAKVEVEADMGRVHRKVKGMDRLRRRRREVRLRKC